MCNTVYCGLINININTDVFPFNDTVVSDDYIIFF